MGFSEHSGWGNENRRPFSGPELPDYLNSLAYFLTTTVPSVHSQKTPQTCCKLSILPTCCNLSTSHKLVFFIKLQQVCKNQACCNLSFADLLQLVETTCNKPFDNKFGQSTCNKSVDNLQQTCRQHTVTSQANDAF